jgi:phage portal protein BeeE
MSFLANTFRSAEVDRLSYGEKSLAALAAGPMMSHSAIQSMTGRATTTSQHQEQYRHFSGQVFSTIRPIAQRIAKQPIRLVKLNRNRKFAGYATKKFDPKRLAAARSLITKAPDPIALVMKGYEENLEMVEDHWILGVLARPNPYMVRWELLYNTVASLELTGKSFWWLCSDSGDWEQDLTIWPLPSSWVEPVHADNQIFAAWSIRPEGAGSAKIVPANEILYVHYPNPGNPFDAVSPLQANSRTVLTDEAMIEAQRKSMSNGIWPGHAIKIGRHPNSQLSPSGLRPILTKDQRDEITAMIKQRMRGVQLMNEPVIIDGMVEGIEKITLSPAELDFINSQAVTSQRIDEGFGVNPIIKGRVEGANRASSATADDHFCNTTINPKLELISEIMTAYLMDVIDDDLMWYIEKASAFDPDLIRQEVELMSAKCGISINEIRATYNRPPIHGGDVCLIPAGMVAVSVIPLTEPDDGNGPAAVKPIVFSMPGEGRPVDDREGDDDDDASLDKSYNNAYVRQMSPEEHRRLWERLHRREEEKMSITVFSAFRDFGNVLDKRIERFVDAGKSLREAILSGFNVNRFADQIKAAVAEDYAGAMTAGARLEWMLFRPRKRKGFDDHEKGFLPDGVIEALGKAAASVLERSYWLLVGRSVRDDMLSDLDQLEAARSSEDGTTPKSWIGRVLSRLRGDAGAIRSSTLAAAESQSAVNGGQQVSRSEMGKRGVVRYKVWVSREDAKVRPSHRSAEGQRVPIDQSFTVGGQTCMFPCDPDLSPGERCNCRCYTVTEVG